jgi:hypothetical protein
MYKGEGMARDIVEIMVAESVGVVIGVAHDWYVLPFILSFCQLSCSCGFQTEGESEGVPSKCAIMPTLFPPGDLSFCHA